MGSEEEVDILKEELESGGSLLRMERQKEGTVTVWDPGYESRSTTPRERPGDARVNI